MQGYEWNKALNKTLTISIISQKSRRLTSEKSKEIYTTHTSAIAPALEVTQEIPLGIQQTKV